MANDSRVDLVSCESLLSNHRPGGRAQPFELTSDGRLVTSGDCLTVTSSYYVIRQKCDANHTEYQVDICHQSVNTLSLRLYGALEILLLFLLLLGPTPFIARLF